MHSVLQNEFAWKDMETLVKHKEETMGSQAIHYAAACGRRDIIEIMIRDFGAQEIDLTTENQSVLHCAS